MGYGISGPTGAMGDYAGFDGWDIVEINQIREFWYQQKFHDGKVRIKFGRQDVNADFAYLNSAWDFVNFGFSLNPTIPLPTAPFQAFGFMAEINPKEWLSLRNGIYSKDNNPFNISEIEFKTKIKKMPGRYMIGAWETSDQNGMSVVSGTQNGEATYNTFNRNFGGYINFEQMVYKEKKDNDNDMQGLVVFGQGGISPADKNDMNKYVSLGLHYKGPIPKRDKDIAGFAVGSGNFSGRLQNVPYSLGGRIGSETYFEGFYRLQVRPWFYLQPDVQFIMNPGGMYNSSIAFGIRSVINF